MERKKCTKLRNQLRNQTQYFFVVASTHLQTATGSNTFGTTRPWMLTISHNNRNWVT